MFAVVKEFKDLRDFKVFKDLIDPGRPFNLFTLQNNNNRVQEVGTTNKKKVKSVQVNMRGTKKCRDARFCVSTSIIDGYIRTPVKRSADAMLFELFKLSLVTREMTH